MDTFGKNRVPIMFMNINNVVEYPEPLFFPFICGSARVANPVDMVNNLLQNNKRKLLNPGTLIFDAVHSHGPICGS